MKESGFPRKITDTGTRSGTGPPAESSQARDRHRARAGVSRKAWSPALVTIGRGRHKRIDEIDRTSLETPPVYRMIRGSRRRVKDPSQIQMVLDALVHRPERHEEPAPSGPRRSA